MWEVSFPARASWLLVMTLACGTKESAQAPADPPADDASPLELAAAAIPDTKLAIEPSKEAAAEVLTQFATALLADPPGDLTDSLRIPEDVSEQQLSFFYKELRRKYVSRAGVDAVLLKPFGTLEERLGDKAQSIADQADLALDETWAFGDVESAAIMHWDGQRFWVASVHEARRALSNSTGNAPWG